MGLFNLFRTPKTKADWDKEILRLTDELASRKADYARAKPYLTPACSHNHGWHKAGIERTKGELAHAKLMRKNAPKG